MCVFIVVFCKMMFGVYWLRLLLMKEKFCFVVIDFDAWMDEDDEVVVDVAFKFDFSLFEKIFNYEDKLYYFFDVDDFDDDMLDMMDVYDV